MGVTQNVWAPYLTMRHVLLESFVWEEANRVPAFLIRGVSYDRVLSVTMSLVRKNDANLFLSTLVYVVHWVRA